MKELVLATIFMCLGNTCEEHQVRVEPKACSFGTVHAEVALNGEWHDGKVGIRCHK